MDKSPPKDKVIGIIGGRCAMARFIRSLFKEQGYEFVRAENDSEEEFKKVCESSKRIFMCFPLNQLEEQLKKLNKYLTDSHFVVDICALESNTVKILKKFLDKGEILIIHPIFEPFEEGFRNVTVAYWPVRGKRVEKWFVESLEAGSVRVLPVSPKKHDRIMGIVQVIPQFWLLLLGNVIKNSGLNLEDIVLLSTPSFLFQLRTLVSFAKEHSQFYERTQMFNPWAPFLRKTFCENCKRIIKDLEKHDASSLFEKYFEVVRELAVEVEEIFSKYGINPLEE